MLDHPDGQDGNLQNLTGSLHPAAAEVGATIRTGINRMIYVLGRSHAFPTKTVRTLLAVLFDWWCSGRCWLVTRHARTPTCRQALLQGINSLLQFRSRRPQLGDRRLKLSGRRSSLSDHHLKLSDRRLQLSDRRLQLSDRRLLLANSCNEGLAAGRDEFTIHTSILPLIRRNVQAPKLVPFNVNSYGAVPVGAVDLLTC